MKIKEVEFVGKGYVEVKVTLEDGSQCVAFSFYDDELSFSKSELIGLTVDEARTLHHKKDVAYLQS